jgi:hypothetical protein
VLFAHGEDHLLPLSREMENALCNSGICGYAKDMLFINGGSLLWEASATTTACYLSAFLFCGKFDLTSAMTQ